MDHKPLPRLESLLSARLFQVPQVVGERLFFASNLSGRLSLYAMDLGGSVPEPLLPPDVALMNPHLMAKLYHVFARLGKILIMLDHEGDEHYQPVTIPLDGGYPELAFGDQLAGYRVQCTRVDEDAGMAYFFAESVSEPLNVTFRGNLATGELTSLYEGLYGAAASEANEDHSAVLLIEGYTSGDHVLYQWRESGVELLHGIPLDRREPGQEVEFSAITDPHYTRSGRGILLRTCLFRNDYGLGYLDLSRPGVVEPVAVEGLFHTGQGEFDLVEHLSGDIYTLLFNIDGASWLYEGEFDEDGRVFRISGTIIGPMPLSDGVADLFDYDREGDRFAFSFSTATSPTQIYTIDRPRPDASVRRPILRCHTRERLLSLPEAWLSRGEDASFTSFDGLRVSARLYLPSPELGFEGRRPLVYYIHGGPQGQERPDFAWFSMPLIQYLTLNGFAVFVPNVRGSTGYGLTYMKKVDRDWGGEDRLDHVHAMGLLAKDERVDASRAGVIGRSYGGYMTLTLATRHPELWSAAVDMFGPYNLLTFVDRVPETWKPYFALAVGDPVADREMLVERSPATYINQINCPLLVIQGKNDPRVTEQESREVVENLRAQGKTTEYLMFPDEGHDVLKYENRVRCYTAITDFFKRYLDPPNGS